MMRVGRGLMIAAFEFCLIFPVFAEPNRARELAEVQTKIHQVGGDIKELAEEKSKLLGQIQVLEQQYGELANNLRAIKADIKQQEQALAALRTKSSDLQRDIHRQESELSGLIKAVYAMGGDKEGLKVILNQRDPALSGRMGVYYDYIGKARLQNLQMLAEDYKSLRQLEAEKDAETQLLQVSLEKKQRESEAMQALKGQREALLSSIERDYALKNELLSNLAVDEKKLQALVASLQKTDDNEGHESVALSRRELEKPAKSVTQPEPSLKVPVVPERESPSAHLSFAELQGKLPWPVRGAVTERFGDRRYETSWDGVVISAREGADIHAITSGKVVYADWLRGYGLMVIVDHGKGYMSLYAFNQSLHKSVGEYVRAGDTLASVGRSGGRADAALYFGIRKNGRPVDPAQWCRKQAKG